MQEIAVTIAGHVVSQEQAQAIGRLLAEAGNPETMVISRCDRLKNACSPCCLGGEFGDKKGWEVYGETHGGRLKISVNNGDYVFIFS